MGRDSAAADNLFVDATCVSKLIAKTNVILKPFVKAEIEVEGRKINVYRTEPFSIDFLLFIECLLQREGSGSVWDMHIVLRSMHALNNK